MTSVTLDSKEFCMTSIKGEVIEVQQSMSTNVQSYGGQYSALTEQYKPVHIKTTNTKIDTVFIRDLQGGEHTLQIKNSDVPVRPGSKVSIACITQGEGDNAKMLLCGIVNHDTRSSKRFYDGTSIAGAMGIQPKLGAAIATSVALCGVGWMLALHWAGAVAGFFVSSFLAMPIAFMGVKGDGQTIAKMIDEYLTGLANEGYKDSITTVERASETVPA